MKKITLLFVFGLLCLSTFSQQASSLKIETINSRPKGFENPDCSYSKSKGQLPVFLIDIMGNAIMKINGKNVLVKLSNTDAKGNKMVYTYSNSEFSATLITGTAFKKGTLVVKKGTLSTSANVVGECETDAGD